MQTSQQPMVSKFWEPPSERLIWALVEAVEKSMSCFYNLRKAVINLSSKSSTSDVPTLSMLQAGRQELFSQCERLIALFEVLSSQTETYTRLAVLITSNVRKKDCTHFLQNATMEAHEIGQKFRNVRKLQEAGQDGFIALSTLVVQDFASRKDHRFHTKIKTALANATPRRADSVNGPSVSRSITELQNLVDETKAAFSEAIGAMKILENTYAQFPSHLRSLSGAPSHSSMISQWNVSLRRKQGYEDPDLMRAEEVWDQYHRVLTDGISRLMRTADAVGIPRQNLCTSTKTRSDTYDAAHNPCSEPTGLYSGYSENRGKQGEEWKFQGGINEMRSGKLRRHWRRYLCVDADAMEQ